MNNSGHKKKHIPSEHSEVIKKKLEGIGNNSPLIQDCSALQQFLYVVSHDIKGPIANLQGLLDLIELEELGTKNAKIINRLKKTVSALDGSIRDLAYSIDVQNNSTPIYQHISVQEEIAHIALLLSTQIDECGVSIKTDFRKQDIIYSVRPLLRSILSNLVANAIKYRATTKKPEIKIATEPMEGKVCIHIKDNGLGMDMSQNHYDAFGLYTRFSDTAIEGRGIGLFLVKLQLNALKGAIEMKSKMGEGTRFSLFLPVPPQVDKQLVFENDAGKLYFNAVINCFKTDWKDDISLEHIEKILQKISIIARMYKTSAWLFDLHQSADWHLRFLNSLAVSKVSRYFSTNSPIKQLILLKNPKWKGSDTVLKGLTENFKKAFNMDVHYANTQEQAEQYII